MKNEKILNEIGMIDDEIINEANTIELKAKVPIKQAWIRLASVAACLVLCVISIKFIFDLNLGDLDLGAGTGGQGHDESTTFDYYAGPIMPLNVLGDYTGMIANRDISYDFTHAHLNIMDSYVIENTSDKDKRVQLTYPFVSSLRELDKHLPTLVVDGKVMESEIKTGDYYQRFSHNSSYSEHLTNWEDYANFLEDGTYLESAMSMVKPLDETVTVYSFSDLHWSKEFNAATLALQFTIDDEKTTIFTYGMNGAQWDTDSGYRRYSSFLSGYKEGAGIIVIGEPLSDYTLKFYETGACDKEISGSGKVIVSTTPLDELIKSYIADYLQGYTSNSKENDSPILSYNQLLYRLVVYSIGHSVLGEDSIARYDSIRLDDIIGDAIGYSRVMYVTCEVTIPARESISVQSSFIKSPSYDYACTGTKNKGVNGFDMVTHVGSRLTFTTLRAKLFLPDDIQILRQNMGFDPDNGVNEVELSLDKEHYYIEVKKIDSIE